MSDVQIGRLFVTMEGREVGLKAMLADAKTSLWSAGQSALGATSYVDAFKQGLVGIVGPAAVATATIKVLQGTAQSFKDAFNFKTELDQTTKSISLQLQGVRDSGTAFQQAAQFANDY